MHYHWTRYWHAASRETSLDQHGFLAVPTLWGGSELVTLESLSDYPCLILLGEPGMGKSHELHAESARLQGAGHHVLLIDLGEYSSDQLLLTAITQSAPWQAWLNSNERLYVILDGLDEGRLVIPTLSDTVLQLLRDAPLERLCLRISCRAAEWPSSLESSIEQLLLMRGCSKPHVFRLAALREADVRVAAQVYGIEAPDFFLQRIKDLRVGTLAARPVTLSLLLHTWQRHGGDLPMNQLDLYELGCLELCREPDEERREKGKAHRQFRWPDPYSLIDAAAWVASLTQLTNRSSISAVDNPAEDPESLPIMLLQRHTVPSTAALPDRELLSCLLRTGLFTRSGRNRYAWAHRTYAEFLAARLLRRVPLVQLLSILVHPYGDGTHLVPQLQETAAWLAAYRQDLFNWLLQHNPMVLLRSDVVLPDSVKASLVRHVLDEVASRGTGPYNDIWQWARKLTHPDLVSQLASVVGNRQRHYAERHFATLFAHFARAAEMAPTFAAIALDQTEPPALRTAAAENAHCFGAPETLALLEPLARGEAGSDPDDELRGIGLQCMWPRFWSAKTVIEHMVEPKNRYHTGTYGRFVLDFIRSIPDDSIAPALMAASNWTLSPTSERRGTLEMLMKRAWDRRVCADAVQPLGLSFLIFLRLYHSLPINVGEDDAYRRRLVEVLMTDCGAVTEDMSSFVYSGLVSVNDMLWVLEGARRAPETHHPLWATLIGELVHRGSETVAQWSDALEVMRRCMPLVDAQVAWMYEVWDLKSPRARSAKAQYLRHVRLEKRLQPRVLSPTPLERAVRNLERVEAGEPERWPAVCLWLGVNPHAPQAPVFVKDLIETHGWKAATPELQLRIKEAAKQYVLACGPKGPVWLGEGAVDGRGLEGYVAFRLLASDPFVERISSEIWGRWAPILISFPAIERDDVQRALVQRAYQMAPANVLDLVRLHLQSGRPYIIYDVGHCWDSRLSAVAFDALQHSDEVPRLRESVVPKLLEHGYAPTYTWLLSDLIRPRADDEAWQVTAARYLVHSGIPEIWPVLFDRFAHSPEFGRDVCLSLASEGWMHRGSSQFPQACSEENLEKLLHVFFSFFPPDTDPHIPGIHTVTAREEARRFRNGLLMNLASRGTEAACDVLRHLRTDHLEAAKDLDDYLALAEENARRNTWHSLSPQELLALLADQDKRYITSAGQLLDVITEALERIQARLLDRWNEVSLLWDQVRVQPKNEQALSDFLALRLHEELVVRGVIVNREVEIKHGGGRPGAWMSGIRTDLLIEAAPKGPGGDGRRVSVIIEVKGCWHKDVKTAMKSQLVERYLADQHCSHGIYLVGWFRCKAWDPDDERYEDAPAWSIDEARILFSQQADALMQRRTNIRVKACILDLRLDR